MKKEKREGRNNASTGVKSVRQDKADSAMI